MKRAADIQRTTIAGTGGAPLPLKSDAVGPRSDDIPRRVLVGRVQPQIGAEQRGRIIVLHLHT